MAATVSPVGRAVAERVRAQDAADKRVFDRLTRLVAALLGAPVSLLMIEDGEQLLFASFAGPDDPWSTLTEFPLKDAYCQFAIGTRAPFVVQDARKDPVLCDLPPTTTLDVVAYLGVPLLTSAGEPIGILCAIDFEPRAWTQADVTVVEDLAATLVAYVEARPTATAEPTTGGLNIAAVAQRTGIGADTLRKWERRYGVLRPNRTSGGQRRYDDNDVARVEWLRDRLKEGFRIGEAAALLDHDQTGASSSTAELCDAIVQAAGEPNTRRLSTLVDQAFTLHGVETAMEDVIAPALRTIGDRWQDAPTCIAEEHLLSEVVQSRLHTLLGDRRHALRGTAVLACAPGERHELGLLALAVLLQADGWLAVYLGPDAPLEASVAFATRTGAELLCLSASTPEIVDAVVEELARIGPADGLRVALGGPGLPDQKTLGETVVALRSA